MKESYSPAPGRPGKLTSDRVARLTEALRAGHTRATAAALAGIGESTLYAWMQAANQRDAGPEYIEFLEAIKKAEVEAEDALVAIIRNSADRTWQAAAWILERRHPDRWGKKVKSEIGISSPHADTSQVERNIIEAGRKAGLTIAVADHAKRGVPFDEWPIELQRKMLEG